MPKSKTKAAETSTGDEQVDTKEKGYADERTTDAETWQQRFTIAKNNQKRMFEKFAEWYEMMYAIKTYKNISIWKSKIFVPLMSYKAWTMLAKLLGMRPGFSVKIYDTTYSTTDREKIEKANLKLNYDYDNPTLDETIRDRLFDIGSDAIITGTGFGKAAWMPRTTERYNAMVNDDGTINHTEAEVTEEDEGYNDLEPINVFDMFGAPGKRNWEQKAWHIIRYQNKTRAELLSSGLYDDKEDLIRRMKPTGRTKDWIDTLKLSREKLLGRKSDGTENVDDTVDSFDVFECYEKTSEGIYLCTFIEGTLEGNADKETDENGTWHSIREEKQPYWHNKYPTVPTYIRRKPHMAWGESIFEITESMANAYNDILNQLADNLNVVGNGGILKHSTGTVIYDFFYGPGGELRYSGEEPKFENPQPPDVAFFTTMLDMLETHIDKSTISGYASGDVDSSDETQGTAEGIARLQEASGEIMTFMKGNFMQFLKGVGNRWLSNNRQFFHWDMMLETTRRGKPQGVRVNNETFNDKMILTIDEASMMPPTQKERIESSLAWMKSMFELSDRSMADRAAFIQANPPEVMTNPNTGEAMQDEQGRPLLKEPVSDAAPEPMFLNVPKIAREISEEFGKTDFDQYIHKGEDNQEEDMEHIAALVDTMRTLIDNGELEAEDAQAIINQLEERRSNATNNGHPGPAQPPTGRPGEEASVETGAPQTA